MTPEEAKSIALKNLKGLARVDSIELGYEKMFTFGWHSSSTASVADEWVNIVDKKNDRIDFVVSNELTSDVQKLRLGKNTSTGKRFLWTTVTLSREMVAGLIHNLEHWVDTGNMRLSESENYVVDKYGNLTESAPKNAAGLHLWTASYGKKGRVMVTTRTLSAVDATTKATEYMQVNRVVGAITSVDYNGVIAV